MLHKQVTALWIRATTIISNWNNDFSVQALSVADYWTDFTLGTSKLNAPVLFFYGHTDWMIGPDHYKHIKFPNMLLWGSEVGHMPFLENREDLEKAINKFRATYGF